MNKSLSILLILAFALLLITGCVTDNTGKFEITNKQTYSAETRAQWETDHPGQTLETYQYEFYHEGGYRLDFRSNDEYAIGDTVQFMTPAHVEELASLREANDLLQAEKTAYAMRQTDLEAKIKSLSALTDSLTNENVALTKSLAVSDSFKVKLKALLSNLETAQAELRQNAKIQVAEDEVIPLSPRVSNTAVAKAMEVVVPEPLKE